MKIVGFTTDAGLRLGVVEGDQVVDLQAVDSSVPNDLAAVLRQHNGDLKPLADIAKRAPASAKHPLAGSGSHCRWRGPARSYVSASTTSTTSRKGQTPPTFPSSRRCSCAA